MSATRSSMLPQLLLAQATAGASGKMTNVRLLADALAELMAEIHGGRWYAAIDHEAKTSFVLIRPRNEKPIGKPNRGEVA